MYNILLVDDEDIFLQYMIQALDWGAYNCHISACAQNGITALELIRERRPDIVFMDISIPGMNGLEVCEQIRLEGISTRLIIMTAHDEFSFAYKAIKLGVEDYLLKPFTEQELENALVKAIVKNRPAEHTIFSAESTEDHEEELEANGKDEEPETLPSEKDSHYSELIKAIEDYLTKHYTDQNLTIDRIAKDLKFENSYLRRIYKRGTGITIAQRIDILRIQKAKELLSTGQYLNRDIAALVGYSDQYYFSRRFKQLCGETPTAFGKKIR